MITNIKTPGVYVEEKSTFLNYVVAAETAIPAFVGYTPQAQYQGEDYTNKPFKISSFDDFKAVFCFPDSKPPADPAHQYDPQFYLEEVKKTPEKGRSYLINSSVYTLEPDPNTIYYLYNSVRLFYKNGGGDAYIVSVGGYGPASGKPTQAGERVINPNVKLPELQDGLALLKKIEEVTLYIVPEATLLSGASNGTLMENMLLQNGEMQTAVSILDVIGGDDPDPLTYTEDIENFRNSTGANSLKYGVGYYPFLITTISQLPEVDYRNFNGGDLSILKPILSPPSAPNASAEEILAQIEKNEGDLSPSQYNQALITASPTYAYLINSLLERVNILPPSGAMAGVYATVDNTEGVWKAPANVTPVSVSDLTLRINDTMQQDLNVDAASGKSVNAIRFFNGQGVLVWGARTLDGNSQDWRYINVRRTMTMIEQSCKLAIHLFVFAPNDSNTWSSIKSMLSSFLTSIWKQGGLMGAKAADAFTVEVGLGTTMTAQDMLNGVMRVDIKVAVTRPAEFIVISLEQEMPKA
jgi:phage tail sheath protein FI